MTIYEIQDQADTFPYPIVQGEEPLSHRRYDENYRGDEQGEQWT